MSEMTEFQKALAKHMETAPDDLKEYVLSVIKEPEGWKKGWHPISAWVLDHSDVNWIWNCDFWSAVSNGKWENAINTEFWERYTEKHHELKSESYDFINPPHYQKFSVEVIDMMAAIWGKEATAIHCEMCAFKYRLRMGEKPEQPVERDLEKVNWYLNKAKELRS